MKCRYCNKSIKPVGNNLEDDCGIQCSKSSQGRHEIVTDNVHCIYCGREVKQLQDRLITSQGVMCSASPKGIHSL